MWPEHVPAQTKMIHFEMPATGMEAAVPLVIQAGAMVAPHQPADRDPAELRVVLDPVGHSFCLCAANLVTIMYAAWDGYLVVELGISQRVP